VASPGGRDQSGWKMRRKMNILDEKFDFLELMFSVSGG
jgi:hypothetical protein